MTHFTKENLDLLWNALEYTRGTIGPGCHIESLEKPDWTLIHKGRADSAYRFMNQAIELVNQMKSELREESK